MTAWPALIGKLLGELQPRSSSLIISVFGDAIVPRGGGVWLGDLIRLLAPLGLSERVVRTAVYRLAQEGWFKAEQVGRRSFYRLDEGAEQRFEAATRRIFELPAETWDGNWTLVLLRGRGLAPDLRERFRRELIWLGFGIVSPNAFAHPACDRIALADLVGSLDLKDRVVVMNGQAEHSGAFAPMRSLASESWDLHEIADSYRLFGERFEALWQAAPPAPPEPEQAFVLRSLVLHEFRRVVMKDRMLPLELLPQAWPGLRARALTARIYWDLVETSERHLSAAVKARDGGLPEPQESFYDRFGGRRPQPQVILKEA